MQEGGCLGHNSHWQPAFPPKTDLSLVKTVVEVVAVNFKSPERIDAFLFLFFVAITIDGLLERQLRVRQ